jgi:rhodanese-related sulfurtransferase
LPFLQQINFNGPLKRSFSSSSASTSFNKCSTHDLIDAIKSPQELYVFDVRTEQEYNTIRISGVISMPLDQIEKKADKIQRNRHIYIHCDKVRKLVF